MKNIPNDDSSFEVEDDDHFNKAADMEETGLEVIQLPNMIWTPTKYKPKDVTKEAGYKLVSEMLQHKSSPKSSHYHFPISWWD
ncbi:MAG: hypothetical protein EXX96DRAFT_571579 [Benjaminiella poitrasii]|nr:MAG: hypothetical protein EXX96DRAFT_571579 [Benjaminiella poitrasii]